MNNNELSFSFSGLKSAVINLVHNERQRSNDIRKEDLACSFQNVAVDEIVRKTDNLDFSPYMGRKVPEYDIYNIRELIYKSYRIIYEVKSNTIIIHRIWHSARILSKQLIS